MSAILERLQYAFDRNSRRTWRRRAATTGEDNAYGYDGLSQVTQAALGNLNQNASAISAVPAEQEAWDYDPTGNWRGYQVEEDGGVSLNQQRVYDKGNRLTQISGDPSPVLLDQAGRMTQVSPDASGNWDESQQMTWDAWGRVTQVKRASDGTVLGSYAYDGLTRRTTRTTTDSTTHCYYSDTWRPLEERTDAETTPAIQYYWGARHRDDLVRRDRATTDGGSLDETRYVLMDYFSPATITDATGAVTERYRFSTFGIRTIMDAGWSPVIESECAFEFAFQGQFLDSESGFLNYGYRYCSPHLGRWLSKDPIEEIDNVNLYVFNKNAAPNVIDLFGLIEDCTFTIYAGEEFDIANDIFEPMYAQRRQNPTCNFQIPSQALTAFSCCGSIYMSQQWKLLCAGNTLTDGNAYGSAGDIYVFPDSYWLLLSVIQAAERIVSQLCNCCRTWTVQVINIDYTHPPIRNVISDGDHLIKTETLENYYNRYDCDLLEWDFQTIDELR